MRTLIGALAMVLLALLTMSVATITVHTEERAARQGIELADLTWMEAEQALTPEAVVVIPLGAAAKEHGPHLRLDNDYQIAEYLKQRVLEGSDVVVAPTIPYHFYPVFLEYPGSTHLRFETARDVVVDIVRSLAAYGPKRFVEAIVEGVLRDIEALRRTAVD